MIKFSAVWTAVTMSAVCVGLAAAVVMLPLAAILVIFLLSAGIVLLVGCQLQGNPRATGRPTVDILGSEVAASAPRLLLPAALSGIGLTAFFGLILMINAYALLIVVVLMMTSAPVVARLSKYLDQRLVRTRSAQPALADTLLASADTLLAPASVESYSALGDETLCLMWRSSYPRLRDARTATEAQATYDSRAALLNEMERRNPAGFRQWLASGARAAGDPLRYLTRHSD